MNLLDLTGKKAVVVGAGGIGAALAEGLARHGADVAVADKDPDSADRAASAVLACGRRALARSVDVIDESSVCLLQSELDGVWGGVDILVNAVGVATRECSFGVALESFRRTIEVNTVGTFVCCREFGRAMADRGGGKIVNISSVRARYGTRRGMADYCASKGAVDALTRQLAVEWAPHRIFVNAVAPTVVETALTVPILSDRKAATSLAQQIPLGRWAQPEDLVGPVVFFASAASDYVTGQILFVDGGLTAVV